MRIVVKSRRTEKGIIVLEFDNGETKEYRAIRGGISWPVMAENLPGYYCILGEESLKVDRPWQDHPSEGTRSRRYSHILDYVLY